ncbi:hypothetical protein EUTSA_v10028696mg [Eutrema salsugineum]|uniref:TF-B3 domain-containing protein n=1 Tax=Eutrema salsugineum TaxID=72664 RepID=V4LDS2_EUTSA|nr:B3 domain-containing protein At4g34400 [Eutrema salsugineum]ESQ37943.1 hypothetical protein EUTSA_v10028696mg [Eutrema salsugineum]
MDATDTPPRFFKVFISHFSSDSMLIPISYYDELPRLLPETAILQGTGGCSWNVAMNLKEEEVCFEQGWPEFVKDNSLIDGDFLTFVYNGDSVFEVSIYGLHGCKENRAVTEVEEDDKEDSTCFLSSDDTNTSSESEMATAIPRSKNKGKEEDSDDSDDSVHSLNSEDTETETEKNKGKPKEKVMEEDIDFSLDSEETETEGSEFKNVNTIRRSKNKGKKKVEVVESSDEDTDSDYIEAFSRLDFEENSNSDSSYSPDCEDTSAHVKPKVTNPKKKGKSIVSTGESSHRVEPSKRREKVKRKIKNPEVYLDDPNNVHFETGVKNRKYELLVHAQLVKDYCLRFQEYISYIDPKGKLEAKTARWRDQRVCIKRWKRICDRNKLKKNDRIVCEILRNQDLVYAIKVHIVRGIYL